MDFLFFNIFLTKFQRNEKIHHDDQKDTKHTLKPCLHWQSAVGKNDGKRDGNATFLDSLDIRDTVFYRVQCTLFCTENDADIFPAHYTWKVAEKGFKIAFMMNKLAIIISFEIILEK